MENITIFICFFPALQYSGYRLGRLGILYYATTYNNKQLYII